MRTEQLKATLWALLATAILARLIVLGSRNLANFDAALVGYTFATLFATFGIVRRYALWLQRPPTAMYWKRGWVVFLRLLHPRHVSRNLLHVARRVVVDLALNRFIWRRGRLRGIAHALILWGCLSAAAVTFPLVFGWVHFDVLPDHQDHYRVHVFGYPTIAFPIHSLAGFVIFHALVWSSLLVIAGVLLALRRRLLDHGAAALQQFTEDLLPLFLLFAISATGLMLTASYTWMKGYAYDFLAILHALTVIFTLLWLPFGKFFHIFQRSAQVGVAFYKEVGRQGEQATCRRCGQEFASRMHVEDLIAVERQLGYRYDLPGSPAGHYQWICPRCRRALLGLAQGAAWAAARPAFPPLSPCGSGVGGEGAPAASSPTSPTPLPLRERGGTGAPVAR
jgi:uncharacterized membrane protein